MAGKRVVADVDGDGLVTVRDALLARRYAAGMGP